MNILVLGNGFDLAHGLPTTYKDFLKFIDETHIYYNHFYKEKNKYPSDDDFEEFPFFDYLVKLENDNRGDLIESIYQLSHDNGWIRHFKCISFGENWIDFEKEISRIVKILDLLEKNSYKVSDADPLKEDTFIVAYGYIDILSNFVPDIYQRAISIEYQTEYQLSSSYLPGIRNSILTDLNNLTRCLEIYLIVVSEYFECHTMLPDIKELEIDKVLSFNYTDTYKKLYGKDYPHIEYDYIHGKTDINRTVKTCNLVLGIDEYLSGDEKNTNTSLIQFKKFYQRIYKRTGCNYMGWLSEYERGSDIMASYGGTNEEHLEIYIFGHSLDITDKDILRDLIYNKYSRTTIYYQNDDIYAKKIVNLVRVIGQDSLISAVNRVNPKIVFKKQQDPVYY